VEGNGRKRWKKRVGVVQIVKFEYIHDCKMARKIKVISIICSYAWYGNAVWFNYCMMHDTMEMNGWFDMNKCHMYGWIQKVTDMISDNIRYCIVKEM
jgi:hypothetical protein